MRHFYLLPVIWEAGEEFRHGVVERNLAAVDEQHDGGGRELLRYARDTKVRIECAGLFRFNIRNSAGVLEYSLAIVNRYDAGPNVLRKRGFHFVYQLRRIARHHSRRKQ